MIPFERRTRDLSSYFDDLEKSFFSSFDSPMLRTDIVDNDSAFQLRCQVPGIPRENITVKLQDNSLIITATVKETEEKFLRRESRTGTFRRCFTLESVDPSDISAAYENGLLILTLPKKTEKVPEATFIDIK